MKLKIPPANKSFLKQNVKKLTFNKIIENWLNTKVYENIIACEPKLSPNVPLKVTFCTSIEVPHEGYYNNPKQFQKIVTEKLTRLGYRVEFTYDGTGRGFERCIIQWNHSL